MVSFKNARFRHGVNNTWISLRPSDRSTVKISDVLQLDNFFIITIIEEILVLQRLVPGGLKMCFETRT